MIGVSLNLTIAIIGYAVACVLLPILLLIFLKKAKSVILGILLALYIILALAIVVANLSISNGLIKIQYNYDIEFNEKIINFGFNNLSIIDVIIDLIILIPIGLILAYFLRHLKPLTAIMFCWYFGFAFGFIFELLQFIVPVTRGVNVSDAIFNMLSLFIGGLFGRMFISISKRIYYKEK